MPSSPQASPPRGSTTRPGRPRRGTLWEEGHHPGRLVVRAATLAALLAAALDVLVTGDLGLLFDIVFVLVCVVAALWVRPRDFFTIGVLPPLLLLAVVMAVSLVDRSAVSRPDDPLVQAVVSGLAHHAIALVVAYGLTLAVLGLRQVALRNQGALRRKAAPRPLSPAPVPTTSRPSPEPAPEPVHESASPAAIPAQRAPGADHREPADQPG